MTFINYQYGSFRTEMKMLLRRRIDLRKKVNKYQEKLEIFKANLKSVDQRLKEIDESLNQKTEPKLFKEVYTQDYDGEEIESD